DHHRHRAGPEPGARADGGAAAAAALDRGGDHPRRVRAGLPRRRGADGRLRHRGAPDVHLLLRPPLRRAGRQLGQGRRRLRRPRPGRPGRLRADHRDDGPGGPADLRGPRRRAGLPGRAVQHRRPGPGHPGGGPGRLRRLRLVAAARGPPRRRRPGRSGRGWSLGRDRRLAQGPRRRPRGDRHDHDELHRRRPAGLPAHHGGLPATGPHRPDLARRRLERDAAAARGGPAAPRLPAGPAGRARRLVAAGPLDHRVRHPRRRGQPARRRDGRDERGPHHDHHHGGRGRARRPGRRPGSAGPQRLGRAGAALGRHRRLGGLRRHHRRPARPVPPPRHRAGRIALRRPARRRAGHAERGADAAHPDHGAAGADRAVRRRPRAGREAAALPAGAPAPTRRPGGRGRSRV
ncbi:MAG: Nucleoside ABC transporter, permease protein 1, partial [uncultured Friedmanniella sp.]